jgi:hypothetical protein
MPNPPAALFTAAEASRIRDNEPTFSNRPNGVDIVAKMEADRALLISGTATVLNAATTVVVAVGDQFDGAVVLCSFAEAPTAAGVDNCWGAVASGNLTLNIPVDNTADLDINWMIDGRA